MEEGICIEIERKKQYIIVFSTFKLHATTKNIL